MSLDDEELSDADRVLVELMLKNAKLERARLDAALKAFVHDQHASKMDLAHFMVAQGAFTRTEMFKLVKARNFALLRREDKRIMRRAIRRGSVRRQDLSEALDFQKQLFKALGDVKRLEDILIDDGKLSRAEVEAIWKEYREFLARRGEKPQQVKTAPGLLKRQG